LREFFKDISLITIFAFLTAAAAAVKMPFLPYHPITPQIIFVLLSGALLGSFRGPMSQLLFIAVGLLGAPVFRELAPGYPVPALGASPEFIRIGLKTGWLLGFVAASYLTGKTLEYAGDFDFWSLVTALAGGLSILYVLGILFPILVLGARMSPTFLGWVWPFLAMDGVKALLVLVFLVNLKRMNILSLAA